MVKHVVMWNIKDELDKEATMKELKLRLEALKDKIPFLNVIELGINYEKAASGRDVVLYTEFDSKEDFNNYVVHPDHEEVGVYVRSVVCDRVDVDYEI